MTAQFFFFCCCFFILFLCSFIHLFVNSVSTYLLSANVSKSCWKYSALLDFLALWAVLRFWGAGRAQTTPLATFFLMLCFHKWWHVILGLLWLLAGHWEVRLAMPHEMCRFCVGPWLCGKWNSKPPVLQLGPGSKVPGLHHHANTKSARS